MNSKKNRLLCVLLATSLFIGVFQYALAEENTDDGQDPYASMVSVTEQEQQDAQNMEANGEGTDTEISHENTEKVTDRYLIKYKNDRGQKKVEKKIKHKVKEKKEVKGKKNSKEKKTELIILDSPVNPESFAEELRAMDIDDAIEYIQPDFLVDLSSIGLEVLPAEDPSSNQTENQQQEETELEEEVPDDLTDNTEQGEENISQDEQEETQEIEQNEEESTPLPGSGEGETEEGENEEEEAITEEVSGETDSGLEEETDIEAEEDLTENTELDADQNTPVLVAVIDTGIDVSHDLISDYLWSNEDQINGWNFIQENGEVFDSDAPWHDSHGTQVAGIIAQVAQDNQIPLQLIACKVFENGSAYTSDVIEAIEFAEEKGAKVINMSFGSGFYNPALYDAMHDADVLFITAAGNNRVNLDETPVYPACFDLPNVISVSSVNADGGFSFFSNYSTTQVDITARGRDVVSAVPGNQSGTFTGTSMSAAYVSGVASAVLSQNTEMGATQLKERILQSADRFTHLQDKVAQGRNVNLQKALAGETVSETTQINPEDDFDPTGYHPTISEQLELFSSKQVVAGAVGRNHFLILMDDGTVWSFGRNEFGQLGIGEDEYASRGYNQPAQVIGLSNIIKIAACDHYSLALSADGTLWEWGQIMNPGGGIGTWESHTTPVQVSNIYNVQEIAAGNDTAAAIANGRKLYMWGNNSYGKAEDCYGEDPEEISEPFQGPDVVTVGHTTSGVVDVLGTYGIGDNSAGQLGQNDVLSHSGYQNLYASPADDLAMGGSHVFARCGEMLYAWGSNTYGQLGIQNNYTNVLSGEVLTDISIDKMALGENHSLFIRDVNGTPTLYGCGDNSHKQLTTLSVTKTDAITQIPAPETGAVQAIAAGFNNSLAVYNGHAWVWGSNDSLQIGNNAGSNVAQPLQVGSIYQMDDPDSAFDLRWPLYYEGDLQADENNVRRDVFLSEIAEDGFYRITCSKADAIVSVEPENEQSGNVLNSLGAEQNEIIAELESGSYFFEIEAPTDGEYTLQVEKQEYPGTITQIQQGNSGAIALDNNGTVWTWGETYVNTQGDIHVFSQPQKVPLLTDVIQVVHTDRTNYALKVDGSIYVWGQVPQFQMSNELNYYPRPVEMQTPISPTFLAAYGTALLAVNYDGTVWGIGDNMNQKIVGDTTISYLGEWTEIEGISNVSKLAVDFYACAALKSDGTVWTWGSDNDVLGRPAGSAPATPAQISSLSGITDIRAGSSHMLAQKSDGKVYAWGTGTWGQLGNGTFGNASTPQLVSSLSGITNIDAGEDHNLALNSDGELFVWGFNGDGQCGSGENKVATPKQIMSSLTLDAVFAGKTTTFGLDDGKLYGLGDNNGNILQTGSTEIYYNEVMIAGTHQNDSLETKKDLVFFDGNKNAVEVTLPGNTPSYYCLVMEYDCRILLQGHGISYELYDVTNGNLMESGTCNGTKILDQSLIPMNYDLKITTTGQEIFSVSVIGMAENSISLQSLQSGEYYNIIVFGESMDALPESCSVTYDTEYLEVDSICALGDEPDANGNFPEIGLQIIKNDPGIIKFSRDIGNQYGKKWTGAINIIRMRAKKSGSTTVNLIVEDAG